MRFLDIHGLAGCPMKHSSTLRDIQQHASHNYSGMRSCQQHAGKKALR
jgi:hypothetical protein